MKNLKVLDVTLRDGGCVNDFNFGQAYMQKILTALNASGVDIIELGYLDEKKGSSFGRTQYINEKVITECILNEKVSGIKYVAMMDYGKYDVSYFKERTDNGIDGIRCAFHKRNMKDILPIGRQLIELGYEFYIQPMITLRYSDSELLQLIELVNDKLPDASGFYIVDSFGEMRPNDMSRMINLVDHNLTSTMTLGFHSHNNLQLSYSNAMSILQFPTKRDILLDCSIMGMGKGAGNLNTELLLEHLNLFYGKNYSIAPLLEVIDKVINQIHSEYYWGYAPEYYLSSVNHCTPSYASHFYNKHMLPIDQVGELLGMVAEDKKISFDKEYADYLYYLYNANNYDDRNTISKLTKELAGKRVLLIAPGPSITSNLQQIISLIKSDDTVSIAINNLPPFDVDYYFASKKSTFELVSNSDAKIITNSNISTSDKYYILNYSSWTDGPNGKSDTGIIIVGNILKEIGIKELVLAGFDGFSTDCDKNYYDEKLMRPMSKQKVEERNLRISNYLNTLSKEVNISFITPSLYVVNKL